MCSEGLLHYCYTVSGPPGEGARLLFIDNGCTDLSTLSCLPPGMGQQASAQAPGSGDGLLGSILSFLKSFFRGTSSPPPASVLPPVTYACTTTIDPSGTGQFCVTAKKLLSCALPVPPLDADLYVTNVPVGSSVASSMSSVSSRSPSTPFTGRLFGPFRWNFDPGTGQYSGDYTVISYGAPATGPFHLLFQPPASVTITNPTGVSSGGFPIITANYATLPADTALRISVTVLNPQKLPLGTYNDPSPLGVSVWTQGVP